MKAKHINPDGFVPTFRKGDKVRGIDKTGFVTCLHDSIVDLEDGRESVETKEDGNEWYCDSLVLVERLRPSTGKVVEPAPMPTPMFTSSDTHDVKTEGGKVAIDPKMPLDTKPPVECFAPPVDLGPKDEAAKDFKASRVGVTIDTAPKISVNEVSTNEKTLKRIMNALSDTFSNFFYYDRKEDDELSREDMANAMKSGLITKRILIEWAITNIEEGFHG